MLTFNIFFFALIFTGYFFSKRPNILGCLFGLIAVSLVCFVRGFFIIHLPIEGLSVVSATLRFFIPMILIPCAIFLLYFFFNKDDSKSKLKNFLSVIFATYILVMPFETVRNFPVKSFYVCFMRPLVYFAFLLNIDFILQSAFCNGKKVLFKIGAVFFILLNSGLVSLFDASWFSSARPQVVVTSEIAYTAVLLTLAFLRNSAFLKKTEVPEAEKSEKTEE